MMKILFIVSLIIFIICFAKAIIDLSKPNDKDCFSIVIAVNVMAAIVEVLAILQLAMK